MAFDDFINKITNLESFNIEAETDEIIRENAEVLVEMLRDQMSRGIDGEGNPKTLIRSTGVFNGYAQYTIAQKRFFGVGLGSEIDRITHYNTGEFYLSFNVRVTGETFEIVSDVPYFEDIIAHSGSGRKIMELSKEYLDIFSKEVLEPQLKLRFSQKFNNGI